MPMVRLLFILIAALLLAPVAGAQNGSPSPAEAAAPADPRIATLESARARFLDDKGEPTDQALVARINEAIARLRAIPQLREQVRTLTTEADGAPAQIAAFQAELNAAAPAPESFLPPQGSGLTELETAQRQVDDRLSAVRARIESIGRQRVERAGRSEAIPTELAAALASLDDAEDRLAALGGGASPPESASLQRQLLDVQLEHARAQIEKLEAERRFLKEVAPRLELRSRLADREAAALSRARELLSDRVAEARRRDATRQQEEARRAASDVPPELEPMRDEALELGAENTRAVSRLNSIESELATVRAQTQQIGERDAQIRARAAGSAGGSQIGQLLQRAKESLPDPAKLRADAARLGREASALDDRLFELDTMLEDLPIDERGVRETLRSRLEVRSPTDEQVAAAQSLVELQRQSARELRQTLGGAGRLITQTQELGAAKLDLAMRVDALATFIDSRILWIRSDPSIARVSPRSALRGVQVLVDDAQWRALWDAAMDRRDFLIAVGLLAPLSVVGIVIVRVHARKRLRAVNDRVMMPSTDRLWLSFAAIALLFARAGAWPLGMIALARALRTFDGEPAPLATWMSAGLARSAFAIFVGASLIGLCRTNGIGQTHFRWPRSVTASVARHLRWFTPTVATMAFLIAGARAVGGADALAMLRFLSVAALLTSATFFALLLRPRGPLMGHVTQNSLWRGWRALWPLVYVAIIGSFLALAALHALGWTFSTAILARRLFDTALVVAALVLVRAMLLRWLALARRRLAFEQHRKMLERLEAEREAANKAGESHGDEDAFVAPPEPAPEVDLGSIQRQTRQLVTIGLWTLGILLVIPIWREVFPALERLDEIRLFPLAASDGASMANLREGGRWTLSLADLLGALAVAFVGVVAIRNIPPLFDGFALSRTKLDIGARYAATTLARYLLIAVVILMFLSSVGFSGKSLGWAIAGLSVGLGLGLQEFVGNLVAGLSLLFERTVRPGDWITVGGVEGIVKSISIRATVLTDFDRRDVVIPNRNLISDIVVNYTRSDTTGRTIIKVGVAYGSDTRLVERLLSETVKGHPLVDDALVTFDTFGDNALNFTIRTYVKDVSQRLAIINEIHHRIASEFRQHDIEISFPQRDLHIRDGALEVRLVGADPAPTTD